MSAASVMMRRMPATSCCKRISASRYWLTSSLPNSSAEALKALHVVVIRLRAGDSRHLQAQLQLLVLLQERGGRFVRHNLLFQCVIRLILLALADFLRQAVCRSMFHNSMSILSIRYP